MEEMPIAHKFAYVSAPVEYEFPAVMPCYLQRHKPSFVDLEINGIKWKVTRELWIIYVTT